MGWGHERIMIIIDLTRANEARKKQIMLESAANEQTQKYMAEIKKMQEYAAALFDGPKIVDTKFCSTAETKKEECERKLALIEALFIQHGLNQNGPLSDYWPEA